MSSPVNGLLVTVDGRPQLVEIVDHLADYYRRLECRLVDVIGLPDSVDAWIDDEGLYGNLGPNPVATLIIGVLSGREDFAQLIHGHVLFLENDGQGGTVSLSEAKQTEIAKIATLGLLEFLKLAMIEGSQGHEG